MACHTPTHDDRPRHPYNPTPLPYPFLCYHISMTIRFSCLIPLALLALLGAGCSTSSSLNVEVPQSKGAPSPEGYVTFNKGYGLIPGGNPLSEPRSDFAISVRWEADLPNIPPDVTVLRRRRTLPDTSLLQNITTALDIPAGALRHDPKSRVLNVEWLDDQGYDWTYDGRRARITFTLPDSEIQKIPATVASLPTDQAITERAESFLTDRGMLAKGWGRAFMAFSWNEWWKNHVENGRCMNANALLSIQSIAKKVDLSKLPDLPMRKFASCKDPEFPNIQHAQLSLSQDNQIVYDQNGVPYIAAQVDIRTDTLQVISGSIELMKDLDRSNYPAMSLSTFVEHLRRGGVAGFPDEASGGEVVITSFRWGLYRHDVVIENEERTYFIPAIQGQGTISYWDGSVHPYSLIIPLAEDGEYQP